MKATPLSAKHAVKRLYLTGLAFLLTLIILNQTGNKITETAIGQCVPGPDEQCLELTIGGTGALSLEEVPDDFNFGSMSSPAQAYSKDDTLYVLNSNDVISVSDMRGSSGFNLQIQASAEGFNNGSGKYLPLQGFYVVTTDSSTGGTGAYGVEYQGPDTTPENIVAYQDAAIDPGGGGLQQSVTFTTCGSNLGSGSTYVLPGTPVPVDLMLGGVSGGGGRKGTFKQNVNFYLSVPSGQPAGNYSAILTYTLIDSSTDPPAQPPSCTP